MNPAYIIANVDVTDPEQYEEYRKYSSLAMEQGGAQVLVRGGATIALEGEAPKRTVILKFASMAAAQNFYDSAEYLRARKAREGAADMTMYLVEGVPA